MFSDYGLSGFAQWISSFVPYLSLDALWGQDANVSYRQPAVWDATTPGKLVMQETIFGLIPNLEIIWHVGMQLSATGTTDAEYAGAFMRGQDDTPGPLKLFVMDDPVSGVFHSPDHGFVTGDALRFMHASFYGMDISQWLTPIGSFPEEDPPGTFLVWPVVSDYTQHTFMLRWGDQFEDGSGPPLPPMEPLMAVQWVTGGFGYVSKNLSVRMTNASGGYFDFQSLILDFDGISSE